MKSIFHSESILYYQRPWTAESAYHSIMYPRGQGQKILVVGAGPVGALAAIYASRRGYQVEVYELRNGEFGRRVLFISSFSNSTFPFFVVKAIRYC